MTIHKQPAKSLITQSRIFNGFVVLNIILMICTSVSEFESKLTKEQEKNCFIRDRLRIDSFKKCKSYDDLLKIAKKLKIDSDTARTYFDIWKMEKSAKEKAQEEYYKKNPQDRPKPVVLRDTFY